MVKAEVEAAVKYLEDNKIPYTVVIDNLQRYVVGNGSYIIWAPEKTLGICVRINVAQDQAANKYELRTFCYDHIESIEIHTSDADKIIGYITSIAAAKEEGIKNVMSAFNNMLQPSITGSTGDEIGDTWNGKINPNKAGGDFSADGNLIGATYRRESDYARHHKESETE